MLGRGGEEGRLPRRRGQALPLGANSSQGRVPAGCGSHRQPRSYLPLRLHLPARYTLMSPSLG